MTQRRKARHVVTPRLYVAINGSSSGGILHDLSDNGMSLDIVGAAPADERVLLDFDMPEIGDHFEGFGRIIWRNDSKSRIGVQFVDLPAASRLKVRSWLSAKSVSRDTLQNMLVEDRPDPTDVEVPAALRELRSTTVTPRGLERLKTSRAGVTLGRTPWRVEFERDFADRSTISPLPKEIHAEALTNLRDTSFGFASGDSTPTQALPTEAEITGWSSSTWSDVRRWFLGVAIICLAMIFLGLGIRIMKTRRVDHAARSLLATFWTRSHPKNTTAPKTSTSVVSPTDSTQTADRITHLSTGNQPRAINQFQVMDAHNGIRYLPRTGTSVVIQAQKSLPPARANATELSKETTAVNTGRVFQRTSGELPVVAPIPEYPTFALQTNVQGRVVLKAVISNDGTLYDVHLVSPSSMLDSTVLDAIKKWRYQPHYENGKATEIATQITVDFSITTE